jgi:hypothetical protein
VLHAAGQPLGQRDRPTVAWPAGFLAPGGSDDVVDRAHGRFGVVDRAEGGHALAPVLLPDRHAGGVLLARRGRELRGVLAQGLGPYDDALAVHGQHQQRSGGGRGRDLRGVERVDVAGRFDHQLADLPLADPGTGVRVDPLARVRERSTGRLDRTQPGQPVAVHPGGQIQRRVRRVQIGELLPAIGETPRHDLPRS